MANITFDRALGGVEVLSSNVFYGLLSNSYTYRTSSRLTLTDGYMNYNFYGSGFTYDMNGNYIMGVTGGVVTRMTIAEPATGALAMDWTGLAISAPTFATYLITENWSALNSLLFNTSDTYNLTNGADAVRGFGGNDVMRGWGGNDRLIGDLGNDKLYGDSGADRLYGNSGADTLIGGSGVDTISGGTGADTFVFTFKGATNRDIITDFNAVDDRLQFENASFTALGTTTGALAASKFVSGTAALDSADRFIYQKSTGSLWYDADGNGAGAKVLVAELTDGTTLTAADIFII